MEILGAAGNVAAGLDLVEHADAGHRDRRHPPPRRQRDRPHARAPRPPAGPRRDPLHGRQRRRAALRRPRLRRARLRAEGRLDGGAASARSSGSRRAAPTSTRAWTASCSRRARPPSVPQLSPREREIMHLMAEGRTAEAIADEISVSVETVRTHVRNVIRKLQARNRVHAIALALERGEIALGTTTMTHETAEPESAAAHARPRAAHPADDRRGLRRRARPRAATTISDEERAEYSSASATPRARCATCSTACAEPSARRRCRPGRPCQRPTGCAAGRGRWTSPSPSRKNRRSSGPGLLEGVAVRLARERGRDDRDDAHDDHVDRDQRRVVVVRREQRGGDQRREAAGEDGRELVAERGAGVAHARAEHLGDRSAACGPYIRSWPTLTPSTMASQHEDRLLRVDHREEREREQRREPPHPPCRASCARSGRTGAPQRHGDQPDRRRDPDAREHRRLAELERVLGVGQDEHREDVEDAVLGDPHAHRDEHLARLGLDDVDDRLRRLSAGLLDALERRRLHEPHADEQADADEHDR